MNLQYLQYILEIQRHGSVTRAADSLFVTQSYLSRILKEVETEYHIHIFSRSKHGVALTAQGEQFVERAAELLRSAQDFERDFHAPSNELRGRIASIPLSHCADIFLRILERKPEARLRLYYREMSDPDVVSRVYKHQADLGLLLLNQGNMESYLFRLERLHLTYHKVFEAGVWLTMGKNHPLAGKPEITKEDIVRYGLVLYPSKTSREVRTEESYYDDELLQMIGISERHHVVYINSRSVMHNVLTHTDYLGIGTAPTRDQGERFGIVSRRMPEGIVPEPAAEKGSVLYYIHRKEAALPEIIQEYIRTLEEHYGLESDYLK